MHGLFVISCPGGESCKCDTVPDSFQGLLVLCCYWCCLEALPRCQKAKWNNPKLHRLCYCLVEIVIAVHAASIPFGCPHSFGQVPDGGLEQPQASEAVLPDTRVFLCR